MSRRNRRNVKTKKKLRQTANASAYGRRSDYSDAHNWREAGTDARVRVKLTYPFVFYGGSGGPSYQVRFTPNGTYDVDPILGSTSTPYFAEWSAMYSRYRTTAFTYDVQIMNTNTLPCIGYVYASNGDPGTSFNLVFPANAQAEQKMLATVGSGGSMKRFRRHYSVSQIVGANEGYIDVTYSATTLSNPSSLIWIAVGAGTVGGANLTANLEGYGLITMYVEFYERKFNLTMMADAHIKYLIKHLQEYEESWKKNNDLKMLKASPQEKERFLLGQIRTRERDPKI